MLSVQDRGFRRAQQEVCEPLCERNGKIRVGSAPKEEGRKEKSTGNTEEPLSVVTYIAIYSRPKVGPYFDPNCKMAIYIWGQGTPPKIQANPLDL